MLPLFGLTGEGRGAGCADSLGAKRLTEQMCVPPNESGTGASRGGLSVTYVPKVPFWKMCDFNVLDRVYCGNPLISREIQLFQLDARS